MEVDQQLRQELERARGETMYSTIIGVRRHRPINMTAVVALTSLIGLTFYPETGAAQARYAMRTVQVLGSFAKAVITAVVIDRTIKTLDAQEKPAVTNKEAPRTFRFTLKWKYPQDSIAYIGTLVMLGDSGSFRVRTPEGIIIDQDMAADSDGEEVWLRGSNPRFAPNSESPDDYYYYADSFRLMQVQSGDWTVADTCDAEKCAPVRVVRASHS
jgi:hypothetical protein